jgi:hypothetical protein
MHEPIEQGIFSSGQGLLSVITMVMLFVAGCGLLGEDPPDEARIRLEGRDGATVEMILSRSFVSTRQVLYDDQGLPRGDSLVVGFVQADTLEVTLPFDNTYDITQYHRIYAEVVRNDPDNDRLYAQLWIDGDRVTEEEPTTAQGSLILLYTYRGSGSVRPPEEV